MFTSLQTIHTKTKKNDLTREEYLFTLMQEFDNVNQDINRSKTEAPGKLPLYRLFRT